MAVDDEVEDNVDVDVVALHESHKTGQAALNSVKFSQNSKFSFLHKPALSTAPWQVLVVVVVIVDEDDVVIVDVDVLVLVEVVVVVDVDEDVVVDVELEVVDVEQVLYFLSHNPGQSA